MGAEGSQGDDAQLPDRVLPIPRLATAAHAEPAEGEPAAGPGSVGPGTAGRPVAAGPVAARRRVVRRAHGVERADDYAWLGNGDDPEVLAYLGAEDEHYRRCTAPLASLRRRLEREMLARTPVADASVTWRRHGVIYFTRSLPGEDHDRLYRFDPVTADSAAQVERLVLDPNREVSPEGFVELGVVEPAPTSDLLAYSVDALGGEIFELRFRKIESREDLPDRVPGVAAGGAWTADGRSFVYAVPDARGRPHRVLRHVIGTPVDDDVPVLDEPDRRFRLDVAASRDGRWVVVTSRSGETAEVHLMDARDPGAPLRCVARRRDGVDYSVEPLPGGWDGTGEDLLLLVTDDGAEEFRLVQAPVPAGGAVGDPADWVPVAGRPRPGERLEAVAVLGRHLVMSVRRDGEPFLRVVDRPEPGTVLPDRPGGRELHPGVPCGQLRLWHPDDPGTSTLVIVEENLVTAPAWVAIDLFTGARTVVKRTAVPGTDPTAYVTERTFATAPDGARVPVTIAHRRDARRGRTTGLLLSGYGAYEVCSWPQFSVGTLSLLDRGMVVAVAHVRGGGELGRRWWNAGRRRAKQCTFVDYVAVRDVLVAAGWAGEVRGGAKVVSRGVSAGGLLQAAVYSRAPRMWRAVIAEAPFVDVVTTLSDPGLPLTDEEWDEWGNPNDPDDFAAMLAWSPYDNPPPPGRPPLLVTTSVHDRRVLAHEPAKWVARLRATDDERLTSEVLLRVDPHGAHGAPPGRGERLRYESEILAWALHQVTRRLDAR